MDPRRSTRNNLGAKPKRYEDFVSTNQKKNSLSMFVPLGGMQRTPQGSKPQSNAAKSVSNKSKSSKISAKTVSITILEEKEMNAKVEMLENQKSNEQAQFNLEIERFEHQMKKLTKQGETEKAEEIQQKVFDLKSEALKKSLLMEQQINEQKLLSYKKQKDVVQSQISSDSEQEPLDADDVSKAKSVQQWINDNELRRKYATQTKVPRHRLLYENDENTDSEPEVEPVAQRQNTNMNNIASVEPDLSRDIVLAEAFKALKAKTIRDLPEFRGKYSEWPNFLSEFERSTKECSISKSENLRRLNKALKDKAKETVSMLLNSPENIDRIIDVLQRTFGRKEWIISSILEEIKDIKFVRDGDTIMFQDFYNKIIGAIHSIKRVRGEMYLFNPELLAQMVEKLPTSSKRSWAEYKVRAIPRDEYVGLEQFATWLESVFTISIRLHKRKKNLTANSQMMDMSNEYSQQLQKKRNAHTVSLQNIIWLIAHLSRN